jgi:hypothetical protein
VESLAPNTTAQQDITTDRQSRINLIWEITQAVIAVIVTVAMLYMGIKSIVNETVTNAFFLIVGFYFSRTNHSAIGGIGSKPTQNYIGR